ncbi:ATP-binding cassette domain-containing protein [Vallitalea pronyensis]|uniref:ATP-binding cassette domain-containing protein n=1 Tax=Vallitalea pronyensis TaxID=1348613 RepID=A0A8J8ML92_9FIRM|nr:ATP-binding cassette domain-containing protein [Vallitalea pronyensis]QUI23589.1 ATP-binding cassette domain-containing protein [Vallitalea pronyensis]
MDTCVIRTKGLTKIYGQTKALDDVSMTIKPGQIYGLIGQNGAGKTTLMRIISGLAYSQDGELQVFEGMRPKANEEARKRIGTLIEGPALYPHMHAYGNLNADRIQKGIPGTACIDRVLRLVDLTETKRKKVKHFSLGMKQRLGIAMALLSEPEFLILDEPVNGLDPMGIIEIRKLLTKLNEQEGVTILISSHILSELDQLANYYGILHEGRLVQEISGAMLQEKCKKYLYVHVNDVTRATVILENHLKTTNYEVRPEGVIHLYDYLNDSAKVATELSLGGIAVKEIVPKGDSLETYFAKTIGGTSYV